MIKRARHAVLPVVALGSTELRRKPSSVVLAAACSLLCAAAAQASPVSPLPASDYTVQSACAAPAPRYVACLAEILVARTTAARARTHPLGMTTSHAIVPGSAAGGADGLRPQDLQSAYFPGEAPDAPASEPQTIALVDAYDDLDAEADLETYDEEFGLPACTTGRWLLRAGQSERRNWQPAISKQLHGQGRKGRTLRKPERRTGGQESRLQDDRRSGRVVARDRRSTSRRLTPICQNCHIILVEADEGEEAPLEAAEDTAVRLGANEVSNSWAGNEPLTDSEAFNHPGTVITFAAGDRGYLNWERDKLEEELEGEKAGVNYPASSPHVVAVGGTSLKLDARR